MEPWRWWPKPLTLRERRANWQLRYLQSSALLLQVAFLNVPIPSQNIPAASINTEEQNPHHVFPKSGCLAGRQDHEATWSLAITTPHSHLPELGTCKSIFTSKSCTLNKSSERSLADLEFKSLSFPWPCNVKRKTNYKSINVSGLQAATMVKALAQVYYIFLLRLFSDSFSQDRRSQTKRFIFWSLKAKRRGQVCAYGVKVGR